MCEPTFFHTLRMPFRRSHFEALALGYASQAATMLRINLHVAFVYARGGVLLGMSTNRIGSRSSGAGFSKYTIHAERAVLRMVGDTSLLRGATLVVVRVNKRGELLGSMPCHECTMHLTKAIRVYGLHRVYYS